MGSGEMEIGDGVYIKVFPCQAVIIIFEGVKAIIGEDVYDDIVVTYMPLENLGKLVEHFEEFNIPYHKTDFGIQVVYEPWCFGLHDFKELLRKLKSKRFLRQFLNKIFPPAVFLS